MTKSMGTVFLLLDTENVLDYNQITKTFSKQERRFRKEDMPEAVRE